MRVLVRVQSEPFAALGELFETHVTPGRPSWMSVGFSLVFHAIATLCLAMVHLPQSAPPQRRFVDKENPSTEIRIGDKLYYVARLAPLERRISAPAAPGSAPPAVKPTRRKDAPAGHAEAEKAEAQVAAAPPERPAPRVFIPPEVRRDSVVEQTLIQPASPLEIQAPELTLPSFRVWAAQIPKVPKPFTVPGREAKPVPEVQPLIAPPTLNLTAASPALPKTNPALTLPLPPPPIEAPDMPLNAAEAIAQGDPVNIISITRNPVLPVATLVVPAGNVAGIVGKNAGAGVPAGSGTSAAANATASGSSGVPAAGSGTGFGRESGSAKAVGTGTGSGSLPAAGAGAGGPGPANRSGSGLANAAGNGSAGASGTGAKPKTVVINRPASGNFDAVVVQSSPLDILPGRKDLLSGRPIYTVYLALGTAKDWTFYFCVPQDAQERTAPSPVVSLTPVPPVAAPYPVHMVRPLIALPSYQKYVLIHGFVSDSGRVERPRVLDPGSPQVDEMILSSLVDWEFRPATRDGQPTRIEFLLAIPQAGIGL